MKDKLLEIQVLYEIAMSIGNGLDLKKMLEHSLSVYLRKLNCAAGLLFELQENEVNDFTAAPVFSIPRRVNTLSSYRLSIEKILNRLKNDDIRTLEKKLPLTGKNHEDIFYHIMVLPDYGFLILFKANSQLDKGLLHSLEPINRKLATACKACVQNEKMKDLVQELKVEHLERDKAEKALTESHERFITVMDSMDATIYVSDVKTHEILYMNQHMEDLFGGSFEGEICHRAFRDESEPCHNCNIRKLIDADGNPSGVEVWEGYNIKTNQWYINCDRVIKWIDGRLVKMQVATDITKLKSMEEQLRQSQKMEAIGTLAGGIAHDFNNILYPLIGYTELLKEDLPVGSSSREFTEEIFHAAFRLKELVKQILAFSRQNDKELKPIKLQPVIREALKLIRSSIPATIEIRQDIDPVCNVVLADPTEIHQIIMNLSTNAYHAMEDTGGTLQVILKQIHLEKGRLALSQLQAGQYAHLVITDTGVGIKNEIMDKLFDPYFTTKKVGKGTGLGLSVVQGIVKNSNGDIHIQSEPGKGTEIHLYLPIANQHLMDDREDFQEKIGEGSGEILLVDDEAVIVRMEEQMLTRMGYSVTTRTSSLEALQAFRANPGKFDLVMTDLTMPNMTGIQLADEMRKIRPKIPVVICTGYSARLNNEMIEELNLQGLLVKPVIKKDLAITIRNALDNA